MKIRLRNVHSIQEFIGLKKQKFFELHKIVFKSKFGRNKANRAEYAIFLVKRRLYMMLRSLLSKNWVKYLKLVVDQLNSTPKSKLSGLTPNDIKSELDSAIVFEKLNANKSKIYKEPSYKRQISNQKFYEKNKKNLQVGDYVYVSRNEHVFDKSFFTKIRFS